MINVSKQAARLWRLLTERPGHYTIDEIKKDLQTSKTGVSNALLELEEARDENGRPAGLLRLE